VNRNPHLTPAYGSLRYITVWPGVIFNVREFHSWCAYHYPLRNTALCLTYTIFQYQFALYLGQILKTWILMVSAASYISVCANYVY